VIDWESLVVGPVTGVFGEAVTYAPAFAAPFLIMGVFDEGYVDQAPLGMAEMIGIPSNVTAARPVLGIQLSTFITAPAQGDTLTVLRTGQAFTVAEVQADGHGHAMLLLNDVF
jgi:hypothetical protein